MKKPSAIDLFSGCGGLTLGLKKAGFKVIAAIEIDQLAVDTYKTNHKHIFIWQKDIRRLPVEVLKRHLNLEVGELSLLSGCPPCQGFSRLRTRNGSSKNRDFRNNLILDIVRFARGLRPKAIMIENVPTIVKTHAFKLFVKKLRALGYCVNYSIKDAAKYGVPQRRKRLILIAGRGFEISFAPESEQMITVRDAISKLNEAGNSGDSLHDVLENRSDKIMRMIRDIPKNGGSRLDLPKHRQLKCHKNFKGFSDIYGRMSWDDVAPTITGGCFNPSKGRFIHPTKNRAITLREAALLQSFPPNYYFPNKAGKQTVGLMIGNALPPEFIYRHALEIINAIKVNKFK